MEEVADATELIKEKVSWITVLLLLQRFPTLPWIKGAVFFLLYEKFGLGKLSCHHCYCRFLYSLSGASSYVDFSQANPAYGEEGDSFEFIFIHEATEHIVTKYPVYHLVYHTMEVAPFPPFPAPCLMLALTMSPSRVIVTLTTVANPQPLTTSPSMWMNQAHQS